MSIARQHRSLSQVINFIKGLIDNQLAGKRFWLKVEISNINFHNAGHCYLDLVENKDGKTIAQCRATIWASTVQNIKLDLQDDFSNILKKGSEILCLAEVTFNEVFGLSINIQQVDKYFALGELERRKQETLDKLKSENMIGKNKVHRLPIVIQKIAVIGSVGTSGHTDLVKQLENNEHGYIFDVSYFTCQVQGEKAEREILERLEQLQNSTYDAILLIRGGGSKLDLEVFNSYEIAKKLANHTKPVLTGIGHETDISVADLVANEYYKTPSALGAFIVERNHLFFIRVQTCYSDIRKIYDIYVQGQSHRLQQNLLKFRNNSISYTQLRRGSLHQSGNRVIALIKEKLADATQFLSLAKQIITVSIPNNLTLRSNRLKEIAELNKVQTQQIIKGKSNELNHKIELLRLYVKNRLKNETDLINKGVELIWVFHPDNVLERGYSITRSHGKVVDKNNDLKIGDKIEVELLNKRFTATIVSINLKNSEWKTLLMKVPQAS